MILKGKYLIPLLVMVFCCLVIGNIGEVEAAEYKEGWLARGKSWSTPYYQNTKASEPVIVVVGGTHGNEIAGWMAAEKLIEEYTIDTGNLIIIPRANKRAVKQRVRKLNQNGDLNRAYPGKKDGTSTEKLAYTIFNLIKKNKPDIVLDLHEARGFHLEGSKNLGQTIIIYPHKNIIFLAFKVVEDMNKTISIEREKFSVLHGPVRGSTSWAVGKYLDTPGITVETCRKLKAEDRINYQIKIVKSILNEMGVKLIRKKALQ